jgi:flagella basal body P-ring formation protein FlgA
MAALPPRDLLARATHGGALALFALLGLAWHAGQAWAEEPPGAANGLAADLQAQVRALALGSNVELPEGVTRVEVEVGQLDPRLKLASCQKIEPYLPNGTRLWGRSRIGLRCLEGATPWNVYLPITVRAWGPGLVATHAAAAASVLGPGDVAVGEVDLAAEHAPALTNPEQAIGRALARALKPGQSLRQSHIKARIWFMAGDTVRVLALGSGFRLETEGQALSNGTEGQSARVRVEGGRVVSGMPVGERRVELSL